MSKSDTLESDLLKLIFQGVAIANMADNASSSPLGSVFVALHTADPGEAGNQTTNESAYTNYTRVTTSRSSSAWTIAASTISNTLAVTFPTGGATGSTITYFSVGSSFSGAGRIFYSATITSTLVVSNGVTPFFGVGDLTVTED